MDWIIQLVGVIINGLITYFVVIVIGKNYQLKKDEELIRKKLRYSEAFTKSIEIKQIMVDALGVKDGYLLDLYGIFLQSVSKNISLIKDNELYIDKIDDTDLDEYSLFCKAHADSKQRIKDENQKLDDSYKKNGMILNNELEKYFHLFVLGYHCFFEVIINEFLEKLKNENQTTDSIGQLVMEYQNKLRHFDEDMIRGYSESFNRIYS